MDLWTVLLDILILLTAALVLGSLFERFGQSAILGYLLAGAFLGPNALDLLPSHVAVTAMAELGVALLLFTIGLEFSWRRLRSLGAVALGGGTLQLLLTGAVTASVSLALGLGARQSLAVGAIIGLSSTAAVVRLLENRAEIDAVHGRNAVGILLLQDIALVPMVLMVAALGGEGSVLQIGGALGRALALAVLFVGALHLLLSRAVPLLLGSSLAARNRDLPVLLAIVTGIGAAWGSHRLGFSPALGAFVAGMLLAESPFATQVRADIVPLHTLFVTLFFSSIGMLTNPVWIAQNWALLATVVAAVVLGKAAVTSGVVFLFRYPLGQSLATGICLAQVGEFSLVIAGVARGTQLIDVDMFELIVATVTITLFLTPYLTILGPRVATAAGKWSVRQSTQIHDGAPTQQPAVETDHVVIVGFGPAGQRVAEMLMGLEQCQILVVDTNPRSADHARSYGLRTYVADATREEVLESVHVRTARAVIVTVPDPATARHVVEQVRSLSPDTFIVVRARYHIHRWQLAVAGAHVVLDEEQEVGLRIAAEVRKKLSDPSYEADLQ